MLSRFREGKGAWILLAAFLAAIFLFSLNPIAQSDTGFLVRTGEYIVRNGTVPLYDIFSYTAQGARWVVHYWLPSVFFYLADHWFGFAGIVIFVAFLSALTFFFILLAARLKTGDRYLPLLLMPFFFGLTFDLWAARPQIFSYLFAAILLLLLERFRQSGKLGNLYFVPPLLLLWANCHAGVILGLAIVFIFWAAAVLKAKFVFTKETKIISLISLFSFGLTLVNPNGFLTLIYSFLIAPVAKVLSVAEWFSLLSRLQTWQAKSFLVFMILVAGFLLWRFWEIYRKTRQIDFFDLGILILAFVLPLDSIRHVIFFPLLTLPVFALHLRYFLKEKNPDFWNKAIKIAVLILLPLALLGGFWNVGQKFRAGLINSEILPVHAVDFIQKEGIHGPLFDLEEGSYLIWRLWPEEKVFLDGRNEVYRGQPLEDFLAIVFQESGWESLVNDKYKINYFLLFYQPPLDIHANNIVVNLINKLGFKLVYWDDAAIILLRNVPQNKDVIDKFAYNVINPFRSPASIRPELFNEAKAELIRALNVAPDSKILYDYARNFMASHALSG